MFNMSKKSITILALIFSLFLLSCASGVKLKFRQPAHVSLAGVKRLAIAPCTGLKEASILEENLISNLDSLKYFFLFDKNRLIDSLRQHQLSYSIIVKSDSASLIEIGKKLYLDAMLFSDLKTLDLDFEAQGSETIERKVWTGEYERNEFGEIITEESPDGEKVKKKKLKVKILDQQFQIRKATIEVFFRFVDFQMGSIFGTWNIVENYVDNTLIGKDSENLPNAFEIKDILINRAVKKLLAEIAPKITKIKRPIETGIAALDSGVVFAQYSQWDKAIIAWQKAEKTHPDNAKVYYNLGLAYEAQGNYRSAEMQYLKASLLDINNKLYEKALGNIQRIWLAKSNLLSN
jgi:tetratricopeptide (TPR) repeat protein